MSLQVCQVADGIYVLAREDGHRYEAPMSAEGRKLTGASAVFGPASYIATSPNVTKYACEATAEAALQAWLDGTDY